MKGLRRLLAFFVLIFVFLKEVLRATVWVSYTILFRSSRVIQPDLLVYDARGLGKWERLFLGQLISLTPGSLVTEFDEKQKRLVVHVLDASDPDAVREGIRSSLEVALLRVSR